MSGTQGNPANSSFLNDLVTRLVDSYRADPRTSHLDSAFLPNRSRTIEIIELLRRLIFPGFFDEQRVTSHNVYFHVGEQIKPILRRQL